MIQQPNGWSVNVQQAILAEMVGMWILVMLYGVQQDQTAGVDITAKTYVGDIFINRGLKSGLAVVLLSLVLMLAAQIGNSKWPAYLGFLILMSTLLYEGAVASKVFEQLLGAQK